MSRWGDIIPDLDWDWDDDGTIEWEEWGCVPELVGAR